MSVNRHEPEPGAYAWGGVLCVCVAAGLYLLTLAPTVQGFDSAELTVGAYSLGLVHPPGYPLYMLLGHWFARLPVVNVGLAMNLMSAFFGCLSALALYTLLFTQTGSGAASLVGCLLFVSAPIVWSQAVRAEVYSLHGFLVIGVLLAWWCAHHSRRRWPFWACFILLGLGLAHHQTAILLWATILVCGLWDKRIGRGRALAGPLLALGVAGIFYLYFPWRSASAPAVDYIRPYFDVDVSSPRGLWWLISGQAFDCAFQIGASPRAWAQELWRLGLFIWDNTFGFGLILAAWGWFRLQREDRAWNRLLSLYALANLAAFMAYHVVDKEVMFGSVFAVTSIWAIYGLRDLAERADARRRTDPGRIWAALNLALIMVLGISAGINWSTVSLRNDHQVYAYAAALLDEVAPQTMIVNQWATASVFDYLRLVEGKRLDVTSFNLSFYSLGQQRTCGSQGAAAAEQNWFAWLDRNVGQRPLCFVEPLPQIPSRYTWTRTGMCWTLATG